MRHKHKDAIDESVAKYIGEMHSQNIAQQETLLAVCRGLLDENKYLREKPRVEARESMDRIKEVFGVVNQTGILDRLLETAVKEIFSKPKKGWGKSASEPDLEPDEEGDDSEGDSEDGSDSDREDGDLH